MNIPNFAKVVPYEFENKILISLDKKWFDFFTESHFTIGIKNNRLIISMKLDLQKITDYKKEYEKPI